MSNKDETPATRLWRDKAQIREQERDEARARLRVAEEKVAILIAENNRLTTESARLWPCLIQMQVEPVVRPNGRWRSLGEH